MRNIPQIQEKIQNKHAIINGKNKFLFTSYNSGKRKPDTTAPSRAAVTFVPKANANSLPTNHLLTIVPMKKGVIKLKKKKIDPI